MKCRCISRQTLAILRSDGQLPAVDKILDDPRASVVTSRWLPTGPQASMSSTQAAAEIVVTI